MPDELENGVRLLAPERRARILGMLRGGTTLLISDVARELGVSTVTVRGDFDYLEGEGYLHRIHGGAVPVEDYAASLVASRKKAHLKEKRAIGAAAAELVGDGETILVGGGTTTLELVRALADRANVTVVTNDCRIIEFGTRECPALTMAATGGILSRERVCFYGQMLEASIADMLFDKVFIGADCFNPAFGFLTELEEASRVKGAFLAHAQTKVILMDSSKVGEGRSYTRFAKPNDVDMVFVDVDPGGAIAAATSARVVECCRP